MIVDPAQAKVNQIIDEIGVLSSNVISSSLLELGITCCDYIFS